MKTTKAATNYARRLFRLCLSGDQIDYDKVAKVGQYLSDEKPRGFRAIHAALVRLTQIDLAERKIEVESAVELSHEQKMEILRSLSGAAAKPEDITWNVSAELLGGLRIRQGDRVADGTLLTRIKKFSSNF